MDFLPSAIQQGTTTVLIIKSVGWENKKSGFYQLLPWGKKRDCLSESKSDCKITNENGKDVEVCKERKTRSQKQRKNQLSDWLQRFF